MQAFIPEYKTVILEYEVKNFEDKQKSLGYKASFFDYKHHF